MRFAVPVILSIALAGCFVGNPPEEDAPETEPVFGFEPAQRLPGSQVGAEPNIVAGPDGLLWVVTPGSVIEDANVARAEVSLWGSTDHGTSWESLRVPSPRDEDGTFCSCDADIDLGPDGALFLTDFWVSDNFNGFVNEVSMDGGRTWSQGNPVTVTRPAANDRQYITAGLDDGEVYLSYARGDVTGVAPVALPLADPDSGHHLLRSTDHGRTFTQVSQPFRAEPDLWAFIAKPRIAPDGAVLFPRMETTGGFNESATAVVARSDNDGRTFNRFPVAEAPNGVGGLWPFAIDVGPDGLVHAVWQERVPEGGSILYYSVSDGDLTTWTPPTPVSWENGTAFLPWIAHAGPGRAVIGFYGNETAVKPEEAPSDTWWHAWGLVVNATALHATPPVKAAPWPVKVGTFCPRGAACQQDRELLDYVGIVWRDGWVHLAFAASILDEGAGPPEAGVRGFVAEPEGGHATAAHVYVARAALP